MLQMDNIANGQYRKRTTSQTDNIANGQHRKRTTSHALQDHRTPHRRATLMEDHDNGIQQSEKETDNLL